MKKNARLIFVGGLFLFIDQIIKYLSLTSLSKQHLLFRFFGWNPYKNYGVAFGLPLPTIITISFSVLIISLMIVLLIKNFSTKPLVFSGLVFIISGAISNFIDRLLFGYTVDYVLLFTGVINLADVLIVSGLLIIFFAFKKEGYVSKT